MRRIVSVWLIDWPVTVWRRSADAQPEAPGAPGPAQALAAPFALITRTARGAVIHALNPAARAAGLSRGQTQADALAMLPTLACRPADLAADRRALDALAVWAERWSPTVAVDMAVESYEGLYLDLTGATHLFGGEADLLARLEQRLTEASIPARAAMAETPGAAWALARWGGRAEGGRQRVVLPGAVGAALSDLPLEALRVDGATLKQARRFGLKRIGDLYAMPRAGLVRRFREGQAKDPRSGERAVALVRRLDQALGHAAEALTPTRPPPKYRAWEAHAEPIGDIAGVEGRTPELAADLAAALEKDGQGARGLTLTAFRTDGRTTALSIRLGLAGRDVSVWMRLFRERGFERLELGFGVDALMLSADSAEPLRAHQISIEDEAAARHAESLAALIDRLSARLGEDAVKVSEARGSWIPERAERWRPALGAVDASRRQDRDKKRDREGADMDVRTRPILMLDPPEPVEAIAEMPDGAPARFTWRRVSRRVSRADGPERLSPEWWRPRPDADNPYGRLVRTRDYYRVEDDEGLRYWLFREGLYGWDYTGAEPDTRPAPSWWMHGTFA